MVFEHVVKERVFAQLQDQLQLRRMDIDMDDLHEISTLGYGTFGIVRLVQHEPSGARYALKCISRTEAVARRQQASICAEREILTDVVRGLRRTLECEWHWPAVLERQWLPADSSQGTQKTLRVMSFNLLAESKQSEEKWSESAKSCLKDWVPRRLRLLEILLQEQPDLIFLQELDMNGKLGIDSALCPELKAAGYTAIFSTSSDSAAALFVRLGRFKILSELSLDFVAVAVVQDLESRSQPTRLALASGHLKSGKTTEAEEARSEQVAKLLDILKEQSADHVIFAGDLNAVSVTDTTIGAPLAYAAVLRHPLHLRSAYANELGEPEYTTWKLRPKGEIKRCIDYIFHSSSLTSASILSPPDKMPSERLPCFAYPSDHLALGGQTGFVFGNVYFLTEFVTGGELFNAIRALGILNGSQARFYTGSLILALQALHEKKIIYRDLKPENVLLDNYGYIKLIDFGCAVRLDKGGHRSLVGTPHYMAPEVILGKEYNCSCDVWSLGVCLYEFVCGPLPFGQDLDDPKEVFQDILSSKLFFPEHFTNLTGKHLLRSLLRKNSQLRIGDLHGLQDVREHEYFRRFSFERLLGRNLEPPLVSSPTPREMVGTAEDDNARHLEMPEPSRESAESEDWAAEF
eukprot:symbB.v1.2.005891.t1/scaffold329.1/size228424/1